ncbi:MAG: hypothetical protein FWC97_07085, partial [Treponema sp.]|nr:hypothetical protein [Treponema sp.]
AGSQKNIFAAPRARNSAIKNIFIAIPIYLKLFYCLLRFWSGLFGEVFLRACPCPDWTESFHSNLELLLDTLY